MYIQWGSIIWAKADFFVMPSDRTIGHEYSLKYRKFYLNMRRYQLSCAEQLVYVQLVYDCSSILFEIQGMNFFLKILRNLQQS